MKKNILKHLTVVGFTNSAELSNSEQLENELKEAKVSCKLAKKDVKIAKHKLNQALQGVLNQSLEIEEVIDKIEKNKQEKLEKDSK